MLGVGWTEMLVIGVVALIVIGPKELPSLMHKIGKFAGTIRRMGQDFQRELNKTTGLDEIKNLRSSITAPLKATTDAIRKEFNTVTPSGQVQPSGVLKPSDPKVESVVDEIKAAAGMTTTAAAASAPAAAAPSAAAPAPTPADSMKAAVSKRVAEIEEAKAEAPVKPRVKAAPRTPAKAAPAASKPTARKATARRPVESPAPVEATAPAEAAPVKKPRARKAAAAASEPAPKAPAKRKPATRKSTTKATPKAAPSAKT